MFKVGKTGKNAIIKWRGKPVFVRHRTADDIKDAESVDIKALRDPQAVCLLGICTQMEAKADLFSG